MMSRLSAVLLLLLIVSALWLVRTQYEWRRLYNELDRASAQARAIEVEKDRLQLEKRTQATPLRVEKLARAQLQMRPATPAITQYVRPSRGAVQTSTSANAETTAQLASQGQQP